MQVLRSVTAGVAPKCVQSELMQQKSKAFKGELLWAQFYDLDFVR